MRQALRKVDRHGFRDSDEEEKEVEPDMEEGEDEMEEGEEEMEEYGEEEMSEAEGDAPDLIPMDQKHVSESEAESEADAYSSSFVSSLDIEQRNAERDSVHTSELD